MPLDGVVQITELSGSESVAHFAVGDRTWVAQSNGVHPYRVGETHDVLPRRRATASTSPPTAGGSPDGADHASRTCATAYTAHPRGPDDYALKAIDLEWQDGGAYALLGPSGCGKTTLLNIISGLIVPSEGQVLFDDRDVTRLAPTERNIAQVFQFPVIYDTMTVYDNLAFPLRNRGVAARRRRRPRPRHRRPCSSSAPCSPAAPPASPPDSKQKISMGRGLVREDVNVIMFDEPLTVIDPHLKWKLRSKLKELHQRVGATMIYVTHDQTEALTFADQVVVMQDGEVVQVGSPVDLFERPAHTFVGHFIGSPGMNILPCEIRDGAAFLAGQPGRHRQPRHRPRPPRDRRPPRVRRRSRAERHPRRDHPHRRRRPPPRGRGRRRRPPRQRAPARGRAGRARPDAPRLRPGADPHLRGRLAGGSARDEDREPARLVLRPAGAAARRLQRARAADDGGQLLGAGDLRQQRRSSGTASAGSRTCCARPRFHAALGRQLLFTGLILADRGPARRRHRARHAALRPLGLGLPRADGAAAAHPLERGRRDVEHLRAARHRPARLRAEQLARHRLQLHPATRSPPGSPSS